MAAGKANVYEMVTARIIAELEKGNIPWEKPWTGTQTGAFNRDQQETIQPYQSDASASYRRVCNI